MEGGCVKVIGYKLTYHVKFIGYIHISCQVYRLYTYIMSFTVQGIDVKSMGRIFIGLVKCGAWGCFDEFNRLEEAVLSAVSMQIQVIQDAIKNKARSIELLDRNVSFLNNSC